MPYMRGLSRLLIGACAMVAGCSSASSTGPRVLPTDHDVRGSWGEQFSPPLPGNTFLMVLTETSGVITGTGSFAGEAGPYGGLAVSGTVAMGSVRLQIIYNFEPHVFPNLHPDTAQFGGTLTAPDTIIGQLMRDGSTGSLQLTRLRIGDPP